MGIKIMKAFEVEVDIGVVGMMNGISCTHFLHYPSI
jgi:hypothetical protein